MTNNSSATQTFSYADSGYPADNGEMVGSFNCYGDKATYSTNTLDAAVTTSR